MYTTLAFEAQKAVIEERLRQARLRQPSAQLSGGRGPRVPARFRRSGRRPARAVVTLFGVVFALGVGVFALVS
jgi:hypothetical protein